MFKRFQIPRFLSLFVILFTLGCLDLEPDTATNLIGTEHTVTATLQEQQGPIQGVLVAFEVISGPNQGKTSDPNGDECFPIGCITDSIGEVTWTYSGNEPGTDLIVASVIDEEQMVVESDPVEKIWTLPIPTLSEWGLIAMAGMLGVVGLLVMRRRKAVV